MGSSNFCITGHFVTWWRHQMETYSALLAICAGNSPVPGEFPTQRPVTRGFDVFFGLRLNKRLSKQSWGWWYETQSSSLWRHSNEEKRVHHIERFAHILSNTKHLYFQSVYIFCETFSAIFNYSVWIEIAQSCYMSSVYEQELGCIRCFCGLFSRSEPIDVMGTLCTKGFIKDLLISYQ